MKEKGGKRGEQWCCGRRAQEDGREKPHTNGLHNHGVDFVRAELELVAREAVRKTERHGIHVLFSQVCLAAGQDRWGVEKKREYS